MSKRSKTVGDVFETLTIEQKTAVHAIIGLVLENEDNSMRKELEAEVLASKVLRYKPVILQEHDAESRRLRAILDTETEEIYVYKLDKQGADLLGITIEEVEV